MKCRNLLWRRSLLFSLVVVLLLSIASWFAFNAFVWRLPARPGAYALALANLNGAGDFGAFVGNESPEEVWWNDGRSTFAGRGRRLASVAPASECLSPTSPGPAVTTSWRRGPYRMLSWARCSAAPAPELPAQLGARRSKR